MRSAWERLVGWAELKHVQTRSRIFDEGRSGHAPKASLVAIPMTTPKPAVSTLTHQKMSASKRRQVTDLRTVEKDKRARAAHAVLEVVRAAGFHSALRDEFTQHAAEEWEHGYLEVLTGGDTQAGFEHSTLQKAAAAWKRWKRWYAAPQPDGNAFAPQPVDLAAFFRSVAKHGPMAASGVFASLEWLRRYAKLTHKPVSATCPCSRSSWTSLAMGHW